MLSEYQWVEVKIEAAASEFAAGKWPSIKQAACQHGIEKHYKLLYGRIKGTKTRDERDPGQTSYLTSNEEAALRLHISYMDSINLNVRYKHLIAAAYSIRLEHRPDPNL